MSENKTDAEVLESLGLPSNVEIQEADSPFEAQQPDPSAKGPWIQYDGVGIVRIITAEEWEAVGAPGEYAEWNHLNQKRLPRSQFSDEQLQYLLRRDGRFSLVSDKDDDAKN